MISQHEELSGLIRVLRYYAFFHYAATFDDIYISYPYSVSKTQLESILRTAHTEGRVLTEKIAGISYYTLPSHGITLHVVVSKIEATERKLERVAPFLFFAKYFPTVSLIGLSGSLAMENTGKNDDVDYFVISKPGRVWTTRFLLLILASLLGMRRRRGERSPSGKVCLNLFFDGSDLTVPEQKQNLYVAHEIVQMKPVFERGKIYERFLEANSWINEYFPNFRGQERSNVVIPAKAGIHLNRSPIGVGDDKKYPSSILEKLARSVQLYWMRGHITNELVSDSQMWFYPDDFEKKIKSMLS
ncbi:hypothetical protein A3D80_01575 [Candidatus Roizmanbacteria bacterium RIFCSPHIGHO2_02_FULL_40_13b]|uniref:Polymerase nucleotidyl transferase domain-containing protein n=1 Tax=Candidatus Roizmanbacteria bacterium RIFCSPHIGHO2_01_FULL_39_24 TaxID=1802032 RepID=A0A1F7GFF8_9BACT|nr:MAG: hypothetical protein A2799_00890 [Candidatus Roizmanbacteria bacterium RIFCSPHIGHO2_01_FULL_39_24]OGK26814.1 MAG: hypothetical protein A3D80_01575 [Candidatus Roizmanbacteria bacterium RIFCSPHIGHO2_02_FULL_40_13b]OGK48737.1 MAG: hypothetical protein A3A56_03110 [Candidatus Roizmanbacteria bacterium RIFCSPLOWO2_01_FULL_40_32]